MDIIEPQTERLILRQWQAKDWAPFAKLNADPEVMAFFAAPLDRAKSDAMAERLQSIIAANGWGFWAVERKEDCQFMGFVGLHNTSLEIPCAPCVEVGWRLARDYWGKGYASEAARASLEVAFELLHLLEVVSFTAIPNKRSQAVMRRISMVDTGRTFEHPWIPEDSPLRQHCLYNITNNIWHQCKD